VSEKSFSFLVAGFLLLWLAGCNPSPQETLLPTSSSQILAITPYNTQTPAQTSAPTPTQAPTPTLPPLPTPTPYLYTVVQGDTMIGIATYFGITYDELSLANPGVNPNFLSLGEQLIIPLPEGETAGDGSAEQSTQEVLPLLIGEVNCSPVRSGGLWCYLPVTNTLEVPAENISGVIRLYNHVGEETASQPAYSLLNLLSPGMQMPLAAYFAPPVPLWNNSLGQLTQAVEANQTDIRYQTREIQNLRNMPVDDAQLGFQVSGSLVFPSPTVEESAIPALEYVWVLVTAYDVEGLIVGFRRWEAPLDQLEGQIDFSLQVFSLGKPIETIEVLAESRTSQP
jgi:LysM repeat protein